MSLAGCQIIMIDLNFHLQKCFEISDKKGKWQMAYNKRMHYLLCNHITQYTMGLPNTLQIKSTNNAIENTENTVYMSFIKIIIFLIFYGK